MFQVILIGLSNGAIYGIVAMAYALVYYVTRVINFANGQIMMASVMVTAVLTMHQVPIPWAILAAIATSVALSLVVYFIGVGPVLRFSRFSFAWLVSTLGLGIIIESLAAVIWGVGSLPFPALLNSKDAIIFGARMPWQGVLAVVVSLFLIAAFELLRRKTLFGKMGTAISTDPEIASSVGGNVLAYTILVFALAGLLLGVAGILVGPNSFADAYLGEGFGISGFVALMIGGVDNPSGAMTGGFILGILQAFAVTYINPQADSWFPFAVVVVVLLLLPNGVFTAVGAIKQLTERLGARTAGAKS
ncbi:MAG TPA: branched-chain amino acid ABC transporter permease [Acidimicrobiales bacterium]|nr:branched-chain amino acid ABC transporter permease [Acidimicrobiales bacterium]